jgi:hypothetical protein
MTKATSISTKLNPFDVLKVTNVNLQKMVVILRWKVQNLYQ